MKKVAILGSTGSIGKNALGVASRFPDEIEVVALAAHRNIDELSKQIEQFSPRLVAVYDEEKATELRHRFPSQNILAGAEGLKAAASFGPADLVIAAMSSTRGLETVIAALQAGKDVALANKEALVSGGELVTNLAKEKKCQILPIDSEHSAIFQCLHGEDLSSIQRIILTSSGGPFRETSREDLQKITREEALRHPNWVMGPKVTIDSSTLMNKGLEVIEAHWLFNLAIDKIEVVVHPESIIHSLVEFADGSIKAQLSEPRMEIPIQYAMLYPKRRKGPLAPFDFTKQRQLRFSAPDFDRFRCLEMAYFVAREKKSYPCFLNAANEVLVDRFLNREMCWLDIAKKLETLLMRHHPEDALDLDAILQIDQEARAMAAVI